MDAAINPYAPGAGTPPPLLAGRDDIVEIAELALRRAKAGMAAKSFVAVGLRGVGKTVVLNKVSDLAETHGYETAFIEAVEDRPLVQSLIPQMRRIVLKLDRIAGAQENVKRAIRALRSFASVFRMHVGEIEIGVNAEAGLADSGDFNTDLADLLVAVGSAAKARNSAVAIILDEVQYLSEEELGALIAAIHKTNQKQLPVVLVGAGLPQVLGKMGEAKSYAERLFEFPRVQALSEADANKAISEPALAAGVRFDDQALAAIFNSTKGYPYFLQEWAYVAWNIAPKSPITKGDVIAAEREAIKRLDESFFRVRFDRMTPTEKKYTRAMASLGEGPHRSGDIAKAYGAKVETVAPIRSNLIGKGMIYSPAHGETAFTVPLFHEFILREMPDANAGGYDIASLL